MSSIKVIVLDFDNCVALDENTRTGSDEIKDEAWFKVFSEYERKTLESVLEKSKQSVIGGKGDRKDVAEQALRHFDWPEEKISDEILRRCDKFNSIVQEEIKKIKISEGARKAIASLSENFPTYLNTATPAENALESLRAFELDKFFKKIYGRPGTKIDNLKDIIKTEQISPNEMLFVDDQQKSAEIAKELGCQFIGMHTLRNKLWHDNSQPFPVIHSLAELIEFNEKRKN